MAFYAFRLDRINGKFPRGKTNDNDIVTFSVFINQINKGNLAGMFIDPGDIPARLVVADKRTGSALGHKITEPSRFPGNWESWIIGPLEIVPTDGITIIYSGTNVSKTDWAINDDKRAKAETKILDTLISVVIGAAGLGLIGAGVSEALGLLTDPIGEFLGLTGGPSPDCNGLVFSDTLQFVGSGLANLPFKHPTGLSSYTTLPDATTFESTRSYTDEATHDSDKCGHIAETDVTFSVLKIPHISVKYYLKALFPGKHLSGGLKQLVPSGTNISVLSLLGVSA